jgi:hypothetical protein
MAKALLALIPALILAGCSTAPSPEPSPTAVGGCDPVGAEITWQPVGASGDVPVGVQVITYSNGGTQRDVEVVEYDVAPDYDERALDALSGGDDARRAAWREELLDSANRTGQFPQGFGVMPTLPSEPNVEFAEPVDGTFLVAMGSPQSGLSFSVDCNGETVEGMIAAIDPRSLSNISLECDLSMYPEPDPVVAAALAYCPTP